MSNINFFNGIPGKVDLSELFSNMDNQIAEAKEQALSKKDILEKVEKWLFASEEEKWLDDYEMVTLHYFHTLVVIN